jgi:vitellogenic carboxypeptidase-like protein
VKSYSGYLTIDESKNSNLFFWFFPAQENPEKAPVILWINDIPGYTCLKGVFLETGPFYVDDGNKLVERNSTWTRTHSMLYIDAPVGSGFSFADSEDAFANGSEDDAKELYEALTQFFTLFKEFQPNDFYLAGEVYAGTSMPYIGKKIDAENANAAIKINLKGLIMGAPYLDPLQLHKEDFYYSLGLINAMQKKEFKENNDKILELYSQGKFEESIKLAQTTNLGPDSLTAKITGFIDTHSALTTMNPAEIAKFTNFIDSKEVHNYLHTGLHKFVSVNQVVFQHFGKDAFVKHTAPLEELLEKDYKVLIYSGQFDILATPDKVQEIVFSLKWKKSGDFASAERKVWRVKDEVAGYTQSAGNFAYALVRNAGNYAIMDQPEWTTDLVEKFIAGKEL